MTFHFLFATAFGYSAILFQKGPLPVKRTFLPHPDKRVLKKQLAASADSKPGRIPAVATMSRDVQAYFEGSPVRTPWENIDLTGFTPLQQAVLRAAAEIPYGEVRSYSQLAARIERPRASRFVGTTLARNPFPIFIPCHRIIRADGSPGHFAGGTELKKQMLFLEKTAAI
jgi:methylated-DNA-[protein]-cysteine S-methyltransferase